MSFNLYQATIPGYLQIIGSVIGLIDKAESYCQQNNVLPVTLIEARLADDMYPFGFQTKSVFVHSQKAIEGLKRGVFNPDRSELPADFAGLRGQLTGARSFLEALSEEEVNGYIGKPMRFEFGDFGMDFVAENFLLSFSMPNFYFHATTAYDILRWQGMPIGKRDFLGKLRTV